jgi:hypothetical protein
LFDPEVRVIVAGVFGAGVTELLATLVHPLKVRVAVTAVVVVTVIGLPLPPLLQLSSVGGVFAPVPSFAVIIDVPSQLFTAERIGADGNCFGAGVTELLAVLVHPFTVLVAVTAVVVFTVIGLPVWPLLQVSSAEGILTPPPSLAVMADVPQLSTTDRTGAVGTVLGAGVTESLAVLVQPFTVRVAVTAVLVATVIGLPLPPLLHVSSVAGIVVALFALLVLAVIVEVPQLFTTERKGADGAGFTVTVVAAEAAEGHPAVVALTV